MTALPARIRSAIDWFRGIPPGLLLYVAAAGVLLAVLTRPVYDSDLFWQLRTGDIVLDTGALPEREPFLADKSSEPFTPVAWAGQTLYALLRRLGGWPLLHVVDGLLWVGGLAAAARCARRLGAGPWASAFALILACHAAFSSVSTRPQTFGLLAFGLLILLVDNGRPSWRRCALALVLLVVWQNLHPSAAVGIVWLGGVFLVAWFRRFRRTAHAPWPITLLTLASPLSLIATPAGVDLLRVSSANTEISFWLEINEWLPLWELVRRGEPRIEAWVGLLAFVLVLVFRRRHLRAEHVVPAIILAVMAVGSYRFVLFWAAAAVPVWAAGLTNRASSPLRPTPFGWSGRIAVLACWTIAVIVPSWIHPTHLADYVPHEAVKRLKDEKPEGTIYCDSVWAGVLVDEGSHRWRVSHDGRYYLRSKDEWNRYFAAGRGQTSVYDLDRQWQPVAFALRVGYEDGLIALLRNHSGWRELPAERDCVVFIRETSR